MEKIASRAELGTMSLNELLMRFPVNGIYCQKCVEVRQTLEVWRLPAYWRGDGRRLGA